MKSSVVELPSSTLMFPTVGDTSVADRQGLSSTIVKVYPVLVVGTASLRVDVTVKRVDVAWSEVSNVDTFIVRPETEIQETEGEIVSVSV